VVVFAAQAVLSELVQGVFLPHRSGDALDAVADLTGIALGVFVGAAVLRSLESRAGARSGS
jgi:VanZ family protein